ncbi:hypothetical protein [Thiohalorhabdus sp.]
MRAELDAVGFDDPETASRVLLEVLESRITEGEAEEVRHMLPEEIR